VCATGSWGNVQIYYVYIYIYIFCNIKMATVITFCYVSVSDDKGQWTDCILQYIVYMLHTAVHCVHVYMLHTAVHCAHVYMLHTKQYLYNMYSDCVNVCGTADSLVLTECGDVNGSDCTDSATICCVCVCVC
jgi:hypothetical protein